MNPWAIHNWLTKLDVNCVLIENVPEFVEWGPLNPDGRPDKKRQGEHFQAWFLTFHALGYKAEWRMLNAADYGDATTRTRFFLMARKDGKAITWPEPSHAKGDVGMFPGRLPWRGAREIIDWSNPGRSLLDDPKYQKKPLSEKTRRRIARGLERFGGPLAPLYIRLLDLPGDAPTTSAKTNGKVGAPFILNRGGENGSSRTHAVEGTVPTATTRGAGYLIQPVSEPFICANRSNNIPKILDEPIPPATTAHGGESFLVSPGFQPFMLGQQTNAAPRSTDDPALTVAGAGAISLIQPSIVEYYGASYARSIEEPLSVITAKGRKHGLVRPTLIDDPLPTVTSRGAGSLSVPVLVEPLLKQLQEANIDPRRVILVDEQPYLLDIRFRMLQNPELARAMGFEDEETTYEFVGNVTEVTKQIGNAVPVHLAAALVKAALE